MYKKALVAGAILAAFAVLLGAFGAHALKAILAEEQLKIFETAVRYQFYHSFALLLTGVVYASYPVKLLRFAYVCFMVGVLLFCGSLYAMILMNTIGSSIGAFGIITPIGGLFFIIGWVCFLIGIIKKQ